jgi:CheY-like chemotaxis protein
MEVQDTGIGIASEDQERIFEPFVRVGKSRTQGGTGLGLAISKKYVDLMGGNLRVESTPGQGSLFRVEVPVLKVEKSETSESEARPGRVMGLELGQPAYRILIVEDQEANWLLLHRLLENAGFQSQVAREGETAIAKFESWRPHFIWMDWRLPGMDGLEVAQRIRDLDGGREVKIVILSAFAFNEYRDSALQAGADDFLSKPFQAEEIFDYLARHLGVRYVYQSPVNAETPNVLSRESLASLPEVLRKELTNAVISLNVERIAGMIEQISSRDPALGKALALYAERYDFSQILQALEPSEAMRT